jgi:hypothetical protein
VSPATVSPHRLLARRFGLSRSPLRRTSDRIEVAVLWVAILFAMLAMPASAALGTAVADNGLSRAAELTASGTPVVVRTLDTVPASPVSTVAIRTPVPAVWTDASGTERQGIVSVPAGTRAGTELTVWLNRDGGLTDPPQRVGVSVAAGIAAGVGTFVGSLISLALLVALVRAGLDRHRLRRWQAELDILLQPRR